MKTEIAEALGFKPSLSEERGLALINPQFRSIFCPGISTAGSAEIRMARLNPAMQILATTIDTKGWGLAREVIDELGLSEQISAQLIDLREDDLLPADIYDYIYARLVLHYLPFQELNQVLRRFHKNLKKDGQVFVVVRSIKNIPDSADVMYDPETRFTHIPHQLANGEVTWESRYFHTPETITRHLSLAGFGIDGLEEYEEQLYIDFARTKLAPKPDSLIEVIARK